jgi:hypothetical protein
MNQLGRASQPYCNPYWFLLSLILEGTCPIWGGQQPSYNYCTFGCNHLCPGECADQAKILNHSLHGESFCVHIGDRFIAVEHRVQSAPCLTSASASRGRQKVAPAPALDIMICAKQQLILHDAGCAIAVIWCRLITYEVPQLLTCADFCSATRMTYAQNGDPRRNMWVL